MRHLKLRKDIDEYMSRRATKELKRNIIKDFFHRREFAEKHMTISENQIESLQNSDSQSVVIVDGEPNFFKVTHDKIMSWFKDTFKKDEKKD